MMVETEEAPKDIFGAPQGGEPEPAPAGESEKKPGEDDKNKPGGDGKGKGKEGDEDFDKDPRVVALKQQIEDVKKEYGTNLSGQGTKIKDLEKKIRDLTRGSDDGKDDPNLPHKEIKRVKDLPKEEQEEMTDAEKRMMDEMADMKERENKKYLKEKKDAQDAEDAKAEAGEGANTPPGQIDPDKVENFNSEAKAEAATLSGGDIELANKIIQKFNLFGGNDKLNRPQLKERMAEAAKLVPDYKPPKEQQRGRGTSVKDGGGKSGGKDPHGIDHIVEQVGEGNKGDYQL